MIPWLLVGAVVAVFVGSVLMPFEERGAPAWAVQVVELGIPGAVVVLGIRSGRGPGRMARGLVRGFPWVLLAAGVALFLLAVWDGSWMMAIIGMWIGMFALVGFGLVRRADREEHPEGNEPT